MGETSGPGRQGAGNRLSAAVDLWRTAGVRRRLFFEPDTSPFRLGHRKPRRSCHGDCDHRLGGRGFFAGGCDRQRNEGHQLVVNPDRLIARVNVEHATAGRDFDAAYAASLSADAVPELIEALPRLNRSQRCAMASQILQNRPIAGSLGWRRWNWSRVEAASAMAASEQELRGSACQ